MSLEVLFPGLKENHLSYSRTETELYRGITVIHATATDFTAVQGNTVTRDQTDWGLVLAAAPFSDGTICPRRTVDGLLCPSAVQFVALFKICTSATGAHVLARNGTGR